MSGIELKEQGNRLFAARQYEDAIGCYSKAIVRLSLKQFDMDVDRLELFTIKEGLKTCHCTFDNAAKVMRISFLIPAAESAFCFDVSVELLLFLYLLLHNFAGKKPIFFNVLHKQSTVLLKTSKLGKGCCRLSTSH